MKLTKIAHGDNVSHMSFKFVVRQVGSKESYSEKNFPLLL